MALITGYLGAVSGFVWGPVMLVLLMGTGLYLSVGLKGMTLSARHRSDRTRETSLSSSWRFGTSGSLSPSTRTRYK